MLVGLLLCPTARGQAWKLGPRALPASLLDGRYDTAMADHAALGHVVLFGGIGDGGHRQETYEYGVDGWVDASKYPCPSDRSGHAMVYDSVRGVVVLFGGWDGSIPVFNDTWELDQAGDWTQGPPAPPGLAGRSHHVMTFDSARHAVVLFGGVDLTTQTYDNDVWLYDGSGWSPGPQAPAGLVPRAYAGAAFDVSRGVSVIHGGGRMVLEWADTWELGASGWTRGPDGPSTRKGHAMVYDSERRVVVLFGGAVAGAESNETFTYDGVSWSAGPPPTSGLTARERFAMAYDPRMRKVIVFSGLDASAATDPLGDTWELTPYHDYVTGAGPVPASPNEVRVYDSTSCGAATATFLAYGAGQFGVNVGGGKLDGARGDVLTAPGPGGSLGPQVRGWTRTGSPLAKVNFYAYGTLRYGANVNGEGIDADAFDEIGTGPGPGAVFGPHVRGWNFDGASIAPMQKVNFYAYSTLKYGVNLGSGDLEDDGFDELLTGPGPGVVFAPTIRGWNLDGQGLTSIANVNFNAGSSPSLGSLVSGGDIDADRFAEIVSMPSLGCEAVLFDYDGTLVAPLGSIYAFPGGSQCHCASGSVGGEGRDDVIVGEGPTGSEVRSFEGSSTLPCAFSAFGGATGATVSTGDLDP